MTAFDSRILTETSISSAYLLVDVVINQLDWHIIVAHPSKREEEFSALFDDVFSFMDTKIEGGRNANNTLLFGSFKLNENSQTYTNLTHLLNDGYVTAMQVYVLNNLTWFFDTACF